MNEEKLRVNPRFLGEDGERFFTVQFSCRTKPKAHIVFIPPFVEEMNRCRSLVAGQARDFARSGYACTLVDFLDLLGLRPPHDSVVHPVLDREKRSYIIAMPR